MHYSHEQKESIMRLVIAEVDQSIAEGCPPFAAVLVDENGEVIARAHNTAGPNTDMTCHAEINLIRHMAKQIGNQRLTAYSAFINAASCSMCASAMIQAGIRNFFVGAPFEPHTNPAVSYGQLEKFCKEPIHFEEGILGAECAEQITFGRQRQVK